MNLLIVTGGSRGLGQSLVALYQAAGWHILELSRSGSRVGHIFADLANLDAAAITALELQFQASTSKPWTRVVFVNNAGVLTPIAPVRLLSDAQIEQNLAVNIGSGIRLIAAFVRAFSASASAITIVNISSGAALKGYAGWPLYCAAKAGMENYIRSLAAEQSLSARPMTCINFEPGVIDTEMQAEVRESDPSRFPDVARFIGLKNNGELRSPESVAQAIMRLVDGSPENGGRYRIADLP